MTNASTAPVATPTDLDESATMTVADALKIILANSYAVLSAVSTHGTDLRL